MNSFSAVERALEAEYQRQCALLDSGGKVEQQTLLWDAARETVFFFGAAELLRG